MAKLKKKDYVILKIGRIEKKLGYVGGQKLAKWKNKSYVGLEADFGPSAQNSHNVT